MIDIHAHLLPGVDDGPQTMDDTVEMCRLAEKDGCTHIFATPHQYREWPMLDQQAIRTRSAAVAKAYPRLTILPGAEIHVTDEAIDDLMSEAGITAAALGESHHVLLEFGAQHTSASAEEIIHELRIADWTPIVAHPEFVPFLVEEPELVGSWYQQGVKFQVTAMSLTGEFGVRPRRFTSFLLDNDWVHFVASDMHSPTWRPPGLSEAREALQSGWGNDRAEALTRRNALCILTEFAS